MSQNNATPADQFAMLLFRIGALEQSMKELQAQLRSYVPLRENDLQLETIKNTVGRMEQDLADAKRQLVELNSKLATQAADLRESQDKLQIRVLWFIVSTIILILVGVLVGVLTHRIG
jgi:chromosome segregation ATPase